MFGRKKYKMKNTRQFKRLLVPYLVKFKVAGSQDDFSISNLKDISAGGAKFWTENPLSEETLLNVQLCIPPIDSEFETIARVVRVRQVQDSGIFYIAIRFLEIPEPAQKALNDFIEEVSENREASRYVDHKPIVQRIAQAFES